jgi:hypothetical protein
MTVNSEEEEESLRNRAFKISGMVDQSNCPATLVSGLASVMGNSQVISGGVGIIS